MHRRPFSSLSFGYTEDQRVAHDYKFQASYVISMPCMATDVVRDDKCDLQLEYQDSAHTDNVLWPSSRCSEGQPSSAGLLIQQGNNMTGHRTSCKGNGFPQAQQPQLSGPKKLAVPLSTCVVSFPSSLHPFDSSMEREICLTLGVVLASGTDHDLLFLTI